MEPSSSRLWIFLWIDILTIIFLLHGHFWTQTNCVPPAPLASLIQFLSPVYQEFLDSAIFNVKIKYPSLNQFFETCCLLYWQTFLCWHIPSPVIIHLRSYDGFFCSCKCELAATASKQTLLVPLLHTTHCRGDLLPTMGEGSSSPSKELRYSWLWISDKLCSITSPLKGRKKESE